MRGHTVYPVPFFFMRERRRGSLDPGHRVVAGVTPRVAAADPLHAQPTALEGAVATDRLQRVLGTGGGEPAPARRPADEMDNR